MSKVVYIGDNDIFFTKNSIYDTFTDKDNRVFVNSNLAETFLLEHFLGVFFISLKEYRKLKLQKIEKSLYI